MDFIIATGILGEKESLIPIVNSTDVSEVIDVLPIFVEKESADIIFSAEKISEETTPILLDYSKVEDTFVLPIVDKIESSEIVEEFLTSIQDITQEDSHFTEVITQLDEEKTFDLYSKLFYGVDRAGLTVKTSLINKLKISTTVQSLPARLQITTELIKSTLSYPTETPSITLLVNPEGAGEAVVQYLYDQGRSAAVYAYPNSTNYDFDYWSDSSGILSYNSEYQLCIPELNYFLTANFVWVAYSEITVQTNYPGDSIFAAYGGGTYRAGDTTTLTAEVVGAINFDFEDGVVPEEFETWGVLEIQSEDVYSGTYALRLNPDDWDDSSFRYTFTAPYRNSIVSFRYKVNPPELGEGYFYVDIYQRYDDSTIWFSGLPLVGTEWEVFRAIVPHGVVRLYVEAMRYAEEYTVLIDNIQITNAETDGHFMHWTTGGSIVSTDEVYEIDVGTEDATYTAEFYKPIITPTSLYQVETSSNKEGTNWRWGDGYYYDGTDVTVRTDSINNPITFDTPELPVNFSYDISDTGGCTSLFTNEEYQSGNYSYDLNSSELGPEYNDDYEFSSEIYFRGTTVSLTSYSITYKTIGDVSGNTIKDRMFICTSTSGSNLTEYLSTTNGNWYVHARSYPGSTCDDTIIRIINEYETTSYEGGKVYIDSIQFYCDIPDPVFLGWHDGLTTVSTSPIYTFTMPTHSVSLEAVYE